MASRLFVARDSLHQRQSALVPRQIVKTTVMWLAAANSRSSASENTIVSNQNERSLMNTTYQFIVLIGEM